MVKSETPRDTEILVRNPSPRLFGEKFRDSKKVKTNHEKTRLRDVPKTLPRFRDPAKIFPRPTFFDVPFATPIIKRKKLVQLLQFFFFPLFFFFPRFSSLFLLLLPFPSLQTVSSFSKVPKLPFGCNFARYGNHFQKPAGYRFADHKMKFKLSKC